MCPFLVFLPYSAYTNDCLPIVHTFYLSASLVEQISLLLDGKTAEVSDFHFRIPFWAPCLFYLNIHNVHRSLYLPNKTRCRIIKPIEGLFLVDFTPPLFPWTP